MMASKRGYVADMSTPAVGKKSKSKRRYVPVRGDDRDSLSWLHSAYYPDSRLHYSSYPDPRLQQSYRPDPRLPQLDHPDPRLTEGNQSYLWHHNSSLFGQSSHVQSAALPPPVFPPCPPTPEEEQMDWEPSIYTENMAWSSSKMDEEIPMEWD
ncbi:uncharacterized protein [Branchiostoma lanceolatum]|uniref:uncharacterized protein n=1 Tax=Branchiostoma lanceolatum TaxID=7740 RepID=UPI0011332185